MIRASILTAILALGTGTAFAAPAEPVRVAAIAGNERAVQPRLQIRPELTIARDLVTFGDLIAGLPADLAAIPAFRAPALGETGTIQVARIREAALGAKVVATAALLDAPFGQVVVNREARRVFAADIEAAVRTGLMERYGVDARGLALVLDGGAPSVVVEPELTGDAMVSELNYDPRSRRIQARLGVPGSAALRLKPLRVSGQLVETVEVVVPLRAIARGETLSAADVTTERRPRDGQPAELLSDMRAAVDKVARRALTPGLPLRAGDVQREEIVARGELVTLVYEGPGLMLTLRGRANEAGAMGDVISVTNPQSKRVLQGTVSGAGRVNVRATAAGRVASAP